MSYVRSVCVLCQVDQLTDLKRTPWRGDLHILQGFRRLLLVVAFTRISSNETKKLHK